MRQFGVVFLINATSVYPTVFEAVGPRLISTEPDFLVARLFLARATCQVFEGGLLLICEPGGAGGSRREGLDRRQRNSRVCIRHRYRGTGDALFRGTVGVRRGPVSVR